VGAEKVRSVYEFACRLKLGTHGRHFGHPCSRPVNTGVKNQPCSRPVNTGAKNDAGVHDGVHDFIL